MQKDFETKNIISFGQKQEVESVKFNNRTIDFQYDMNLKSLENLDSIYELDISLSWKEGPRDITLSRFAYIAGYKPLN